MIKELIKISYPQALAKLIIIIKDIQYAEDFLQSAVEQALIKWPESQPDNTVAWLVKVAQNKFIDYYRRQQKQQSIDSIQEPTELPDLSEQGLLLSYNDDLLRLIFTCCHPALNQETQIILALKHVLGLNLTQIANALIINSTTLEKRLTRAKKKIAVNQIKYEVPSPKYWPDRLAGVLKTIYLLFNEGYFTTQDTTFVNQSLCREAIRLARLLHQCIKNDSEVIGLLALLLQQDARLPARVDSRGQMILLAEQERRLWKKTNIQEANSLVEKAVRLGGGTPYVIQAAIASLHNNVVESEKTDWKQIHGLYQLLIAQDDNPIIQLNSAVALAKIGQPKKAINQVIGLSVLLKKYRHYHTALAGLYFENNQYRHALSQYEISLKNTESISEVEFINKRIYHCQFMTSSKK